MDSSGEVKGVDSLHGMDVFNALVSDALKKWRFQAATLNGKPITSKTVIAFAFQPPALFALVRERARSMASRTPEIFSRADQDCIIRRESCPREANSPTGKEVANPS